MYIPKRDREVIKRIEHCINLVTGIDKDVYLDTRKMNRENKVLRYTWIYEVYNRTLLGTVAISELIGRNQSNVTRAIQAVNDWKKNTRKKEYILYKEISNEIKKNFNTRPKEENRLSSAIY